MTREETKKQIEELKKQISKTKAEHDFAKAMNLALKLVLNGSYGAFCHKAFSVSNANIANAITANSREVIVWMLDHIEDYWYNEWYLDKETHNLLGYSYITEGEDGKIYYHRLDGKLVDEFGRNKTNTKDNTTGVEDIFRAYFLNSRDIIESDKEEIIWKDKKYKVIHKIFIHDFSDVKPLSQEWYIPPDLKSKKWDETRGVRKEPVIIYGDTDSLDNQSVINTESGEYTIENLYNKNISSGSAGST